MGFQSTDSLDFVDNPLNVTVTFQYTSKRFFEKQAIIFWKRLSDS